MNETSQPQIPVSVGELYDKLAILEIKAARITETGRLGHITHELHLLRSVELSLIALNLPTRRPFDTIDQLDDRLVRAEAAFTLAYELGTNLVLARVGGIPPDADPTARETFIGAVRELGRRADHRGVRLAIETGADAGPPLRVLLDTLASPGLAASIDPAALLQHGHDPVDVTQRLGPWVAHAYATDSTASSLVSLARRGGFPSGALDWEEYLGALEEINYRGYLTIWPDPTREPGPQFTVIADRLKQL